MIRLAADYPASHAVNLIWEADAQVDNFRSFHTVWWGGYCTWGMDA